MTRKEKIKDLQKQILSKKEEISELENQIKSEIVADFCERHNLSEGQHFLYRGKECVGVEADSCSVYSFLNTHPLNKDGSVSKRTISISYREEIKPI